MKKTISILLICVMLASMLAAAIPVSAAIALPKSGWSKPWENGESGWVKITSYDELKSAFASGTPEAPTKYYLANDITIGSGRWTKKSENFILDGNGKSFIYNANSCAVFSEINNGTIRNLKLTGTLDCDGGDRSGGPAFAPLGDGWLWTKKVIIENVSSDVKLTAKNQDTSFKTLAGVVAHAGEGSSFTDVTVAGEFKFQTVNTSDTLGGIGCIVGEVRGATTFTNCIVKNVKISVSDYKALGKGESYAAIGLLTSRVIGNGKTEFKNCTASGNVVVNVAAAQLTYVGGLVGYITAETAFSKCTSTVKISTNGISGSFGGLVGASTAGLTFTDCVNDGSVSVINNLKNDQNKFRGVGGFVGGTMANAPMTFKNCTNTKNATITHSTPQSQAGTGGFIGRVTGETGNGYANQKITFNNCKNEADIVNASTLKGTAPASNAELSRGGFIGILNTPAGVEVSNSVNSGNIVSGENDAASTYEGAGGFIGLQRCLGFNWVANIKNYDVKFTNCVNLGNVQDASAASGFLGKSIEMALLDDTYKYTATFENCANLGNLVAPICAGMLADQSNNNYGGAIVDIVANNCANGGSMYGVDSGSGVVGGIIGDIRFGSIKVNNSINTGHLHGKDYTSGIVGSNTSDVTTEIKNSINTGKLESVFENVDPIGTGKFTFENNIYLTGCVYEEFDDVEEVDQATVEAAISELGLFACYNFIELGEEIARAEKLDSSDYGREEWKPLADALAEAKAVYDGGMITVNGSNVDILTQAEVNEVFYALVDARVALVADMTALDEAIAKAEALKSSDYTSASWKLLADALEDAKLLKTTVESQDQVNDALRALTNATAALVKVNKPSTPTTPDTPDTPDAPTTPDTPSTPEEPEEPEDNTGDTTEKPTEAPKATEPAEEKGCGGVIGTSAIALAAVLTLGAGLSLRRKD